MAYRNQTPLWLKDRTIPNLAGATMAGFVLLAVFWPLGLLVLALTTTMAAVIALAKVRELLAGDDHAES